MNVYDDTTGGFSTLNGALSVGRMNLPTAITGSQVIFAGGPFTPYNGVSGSQAGLQSVVDVFNADTNTVATYQLPTARAAFNFAAVSNNNPIG